MSTSCLPDPLAWRPKQPVDVLMEDCAAAPSGQISAPLCIRRSAFVPFPGKTEGGWKEQEELDGRTSGPGRFLGSTASLSRVTPQHQDADHLWLSGEGGAEIRAPSPSPSTPTPLLSASPSRSFPISLYYQRHLQPFYAGRSQSCRERCSLLTCAQPAAAAAAQPDRRRGSSGQDGEEEKPGRERAGVRERNPVPYPDLPVAADQVWRRSLD